MNRRGGVCIVVLSVVLAACSGGAAGSAGPGAVAPVLSAAFARVAPSALGPTGDFEFGDTARLSALAAADRKVWGVAVYSGSGTLGSSAAFTGPVIGLDLAAAQAMLAVGRPPSSMVVVIGGQQKSAVEQAATKSGWTGTGTLTRALDLSDLPDGSAAIMLAAQKIRATDADVVLGLATSDPALVDGPSGSDREPAIAASINCLGDVVSASGTTIGAVPVSVGVRADTSGAKVTSVICLRASDQSGADTLATRVQNQLASGSSQADRRPWTELLPGATVDVLSGGVPMVRIVSDTSALPVTRLTQMLARADLPGL